MQAALTAIRRAQGTTSGTWVFVGWDGEAIAGGSRVRLTLPHEKIVVHPSTSLEDLTMDMALAAARLAKKMPEALSGPRLKKRKRLPFGMFRNR